MSIYLLLLKMAESMPALNQDGVANASSSDLKTVKTQEPEEVDPERRRATFVANLWNPLPAADKLHFNKNRFLQIFAGILITLSGGSQYAFGIFSNKIKGVAGFDQSDLTMITTVASLLNACNFPAGVLYDYAGPKPVIAASTFLSCLGFILLALIFQDIIHPTVVTVAIANGLSNMGAGFIDCSALITNLFNFPISRGEIMIIQKTMYGLGSTFLALAFDGFFSPSGNYIGYAVFVTVFIFLAGVFAVFAFRLPTYKRTIREMKYIATLSPEDQARSAELEAHSFEMHQNPRLLDRRRLNYAVTCLLGTLVFFSSFSIAKTYYHFESNTLTGLTIAACLCIMTFVPLVAPIEFPQFFDYAFLPDIHAPEESVDSDLERENKNAASVNGRAISESSPLIGQEVDNRSECNDGNDARAADGRASAFLAGPPLAIEGGAPIPVPEAADPNVIPALRTGFLQNLKGPVIWCFWFSNFAMGGTTTVIINNVPQIYSALNGGMDDTVNTSLNVALYGIGSSIGRVIVGFMEIYLHRLNALKRAKQLDYIARKEQGLLDPNEPEVDLTPVYHNFTSTIVFFFPFGPLVMALMCFLISIVPASMLFIPVCVSGIAIGCYLCVVALATREIFSVDIAKHYNFFASSGIASSILLNRMLFGMSYDHQTDLHPATDSSGGRSCDGHECVRMPLLVLAGLSLLVVGSTGYITWFWYRLRKTF